MEWSTLASAISGQRSLVALLQLATEDYVVLYRLSKLEKIPDLVQEILGNEVPKKSVECEVWSEVLVSVLV